MVFLITNYLLSCFFYFIDIYSSDIAKIWGKGYNEHDKPLTMPTLDDLEIDGDDYDYKKKRDEYINDVICPAYSYFKLRNEIEYLQSSDACLYEITLYSFLLLGLVFNFLKLELVDSWIIGLIIGLVIFFISFSLIGFIYYRSGIFKKLRIKHFDFEAYKDYSNNDFIKAHYDYLLSIKKTVWFRSVLCEIMRKISFVIYILFFFTIPE